VLSSICENGKTIIQTQLSLKLDSTIVLSYINDVVSRTEKTVVRVGTKGRNIWPGYLQIMQ
jgi:hypothetical protein